MVGQADVGRDRHVDQHPAQRTNPDRVFAGMPRRASHPYGTRPFPQVQNALRAEQWLHRSGSANAEQRMSIKQTLKDAFYPDADDWKIPVWQQAREAYLQALHGLSATQIPTALDVA